jgi:methionyl aminopeptidase
MDEEELQNYLKASEAAKQVKEFARTLVKPGVKLLDIAQEIEKKIIESGVKPAFPVNISINSFAAHYAPKINDDAVFGEKDLVKIDFGTHVEGFICDSAITVDASNENGKMVEAAEKALEAALSIIRAGKNVREVGKAIEQEIKARGFVPIYNLSGHRLEQYNLHGEPEIPNYETGGYVFREGDVFACEPFATNGAGRVVEGSYVEIYSIEELKGVRLPNSRKLLEHVFENYNVLPFAKRWLSPVLSGVSLDLALADLMRQGILHAYPVLREAKNGLVAQAESSFIVEKDSIKVLV